MSEFTCSYCKAKFNSHCYRKACIACWDIECNARFDDVNPSNDAYTALNSCVNRFTFNGEQNIMCSRAELRLILAQELTRFQLQLSDAQKVADAEELARN